MMETFFPLWQVEVNESNLKKILLLSRYHVKQQLVLGPDSDTWDGSRQLS